MAAVWLMWNCRKVNCWTRWWLSVTVQWRKAIWQVRSLLFPVKSYRQMLHVVLQLLCKEELPVLLCRLPTVSRGKAWILMSVVSVHWVPPVRFMWLMVCMVISIWLIPLTFSLLKCWKMLRLLLFMVLVLLMVLYWSLLKAVVWKLLPV